MAPPEPKQFTSYQELPPNARILTKSEVIVYHKKKIETWQNQRETWPFRYLMPITGMSSILSCTSIDTVVRKIFMLPANYKPMFTLVPTLVLPTFCACVGYGLFITRKVLHQGQGTCTTCFSIRGGALHAFMATVYPLAISTIGCYISSRNYHTYGGQYRRSELELVKALKVPGYAKTLIGALVLGNFFIGGLLAYKQIECLDNILTKSSQEAREDMQNFE